MLSNREVRKIFSKCGWDGEVSQDVVKNIKKDTSKKLEEDVRLLIAETNKQNELRKQLKINEIKRIDRNLYLNYSEKQLKDINSFKLGEIGQSNSETISSGDNIQQVKSKKDIIKEADETIRGYL